MSGKFRNVPSPCRRRVPGASGPGRVAGCVPELLLLEDVLHLRRSARSWRQRTSLCGAKYGVKKMSSTECTAMMYCQNMCSTASRRGADRYFARCSSKRQALEYSFWLRLIGFACSEPCRSGLSELPAPRIFCADGARGLCAHLRPHVRPVAVHEHPAPDERRAAGQRRAEQEPGEGALVRSSHIFRPGDHTSRQKFNDLNRLRHPHTDGEALRQDRVPLYPTSLLLALGTVGCGSCGRASRL